MTASNRYYQSTFQPAVGSNIKSAGQKTQFQLIQDAFDRVQTELNASAAIMGVLGLSGFPASFVGGGRRLLRVNAAESAVEFSNGIPVIAVAASRDLATTDVGCCLVCSSASPIILTLQPYATIAIENESPILIAQTGAGKVTVAAGAGVTLVSSGGLLSTNGTGAQITLLMIATNTALIGGDRIA